MIGTIGTASTPENSPRSRLGSAGSENGAGGVFGDLVWRAIAGTEAAVDKISQWRATQGCKRLFTNCDEWKQPTSRLARMVCGAGIGNRGVASSAAQNPPGLVNSA